MSVFALRGVESIQRAAWALLFMTLLSPTQAGTVAVQYGPPSGLDIAPLDISYSGPPLSIFAPNYEVAADIATGKFQAFSGLDSSNNDLVGFPIAYSMVLSPYSITNVGSAPIVIPQGAFRMDVFVTYRHFAGFDGGSSTQSGANLTMNHNGLQSVALFSSAVAYSINPGGASTLVTNTANAGQLGGGAAVIHGHDETGVNASLLMPQFTLDPGDSFTFSTLLTTNAAANGDGIEANVDAYYGVNGAQLSLVLPPWVTTNDIQFGAPVPFDWVTIARPGDANGDGVVDILDLDILSTHFGRSMATFHEGDFNGDGMVDILDLDILSMNFGSGPSAAIPEPSTGLAALLMLLAATHCRDLRR